MNPRSFLIIQTAFIGDVILATALIEKLHQFYPNANIDFLVRKGNETLLANHPFLREAIVFDKKKKYKSLYDLIGRIRRTNYDVVVNVQRFATTGFITVLSGAKETVGYNKNPLSFLFDTRIAHQIGEVHEVERNQRLIEAFTDKVPAKPKLYPSD